MTNPNTSTETNGSLTADVAQNSASTTTVTRGDLDKLAEDLTKKSSRKLKSVVDKFENRIEEKEAKTTEILAIFMTLFTFISVNVSVFTKVKDLFTAIIFMVIMTLCSTFLLSFVLTVTSKHLPNRKTVLGLLLSLFCLILLAILISITSWNYQLNTQ